MKILSRSNTKVSKENKRILQTLSPYLFTQRLIYMGAKYGTNIGIVNEYLTTQLCSNCGHLNKEIGPSKIYYCDCGMLAGRDTNAAKNILKEGLKMK